MISVNTDLASLIGLASYSRHTRAINQSLERLATGKRINRASDDPAGAVSVEKLSTEQRDIAKKLDKFEFETARYYAIDGAKSVVQDLMLELQGLVVTAANRGAVSGAEREAMQIQVDSIIETIDFLSNTSTFAGEAILRDSHATGMGQTEIEVKGGDGSVQVVKVSLADLRSGGKLNLVDGDLEGAQRSVDSAAKGVGVSRAGIGANIKSIESQSRALQIQLEGITSERSRVEDVDFAKEVSNLVRYQVLQNASVHALNIAQSLRKTNTLALLQPRPHAA